ncbi:MAG: nitroreductase family protein [Tissierellales bacterium]|jgi:nitroreductase|nr:nitroreductase family protein [Tissierellales bacterium]
MKNFKELAETRRSVKYFDPEKPLEDDIIKNIVNLASNTPSCFNLQPWEIILVKSDEAKKRLYENACRQKCVLDASAIAIIIGDMKGFEKENPFWKEKVDLGLSQEKVDNYIRHSEKILFAEEDQKIKFASTNSALFAMSLIYAASYYGVGSQPMIGFNEEIAKMLYQIPDNKTITLMIALGYRDESKPLKVKERRLNYDEMVKEI